MINFVEKKKKEKPLLFRNLINSANYWLMDKFWYKFMSNTKERGQEGARERERDRDRERTNKYHLPSMFALILIKRCKGITFIYISFSSLKFPFKFSNIEQILSISYCCTFATLTVLFASRTILQLILHFVHSVTTIFKNKWFILL